MLFCGSFICRVCFIGQADRNEKTHLSFFCGMVLHILIEIVKISKQFFFQFSYFGGSACFISFPAVSQLLVRADFDVQMIFWHLDRNYGQFSKHFSISQSHQFFDQSAKEKSCMHTEVNKCTFAHT